jgi:hypothetical protein
MGVSRRDVIGSVVLTDGKEYLTILNCPDQVGAERQKARNFHP